MAEGLGVGGLIHRLRGMVPAVLEPLLDPLGGRFGAENGGESSKKPLSARLRVPLLPISPPPLLPGYGETSPASLPRRGLTLASEEPLAERDERDDGSRLDAFRRAGMGLDGLKRTDLGTGLGNDDDDDAFFSPREVMSITSCCCCDSRTGFGNCTSNHAEFCDAVEDFASDDSLSLSSPFLRMKIESELQPLRLNLTEETGKREAAEMNLLKMKNKWKRLVENLHQVGVSFPAILQDEEALLELDPAQICQDILFKKSVSEAIAREVAGAEAAAAAEAVIDAKNQYISLLQRRLNYHKAVNREMSLRNQEIALLARQQHARRRKIRRLILVLIGFSATLGASLLASSYFDHFFEDPLALFCHERPAESEALHHGAD